MPNRQNDRIWARNSNNIKPIGQMKFPAKIQVWDMMSHRALSELHIIPPKQTINGAYYRDNILAKTCSDATNRTANTGSILERSMLADMSDFLFIQDGAPTHTANLTQRWCAGIPEFSSESLTFSFFSLPNPLKTLSIVLFTHLLVPLTHYSTLFSSSNPLKTLLSPFSSPSFTKDTGI